VPAQAGNKSYTCPFHGWTFNNSGKLLKVKDPANAGYPESFNCEGSHDLTKVARFESYRGFLFGSLKADVVPLVEHLGESAKIIDMIVDQSADGLEVLRGSSTYIYEGNWKPPPKTAPTATTSAPCTGTTPPPRTSASSAKPVTKTRP
jgi:benzoate/toluate 1,2-dioxygenase alpha subunit